MVFVLGLLLSVLVPLAFFLLPFFVWLAIPTLAGLAVIFVISVAHKQRLFRFLRRA
jgi:heme exporter protein D